MVAFAGTTLLFYQHTFGQNQYDDSYITYRYAMRLAEGDGLTFNSYERVNSASSFLYTVILAILYRLGATDLELTASLLGLLMGCAVVGFACAMAFRVTGSRMLVLLFVLPLSLTGSLTGWAASGMETLLFAALTLAFLHLYLFTEVSRWIPFAVLGLALLCRPEAFLLLGLALAREAMEWRNHRRFGNLVLVLLLGLLPFVALLAFNFLYFGNPLPHPLQFKRAAIYYSPSWLDQTVRLVTFYVRYFGAYGLLALGAVATLAWTMLRQRTLVPTPLGWLAGYVVVSFASFTVLPHSDQQRYTIHAIPLLAILALLAWTQWHARLPTRGVRLGLLVVVLALVVGGATANLAATVADTQRSAAHQETRERMGRWLQENAAEGDRILSSDLGAIAYFARKHDFVDALGLTSAEIVPMVANHPDQMGPYVAQMRPAWIADTYYRVESGAEVPAAEMILRHPQRFYHDVPLPPDADLSVPYGRETVTRETAGGVLFGLDRLTWP